MIYKETNCKQSDTQVTQKKTFLTIKISRVECAMKLLYNDFNWDDKQGKNKKLQKEENKCMEMDTEENLCCIFNHGAFVRKYTYKTNKSKIQEQ